MKSLQRWNILIALGLATLTALAFRSFANVGSEESQAVSLIESVVAVCRFLGDLFMRALKMIIVPLVVSSVIAGISTLRGVDGFARLGAKTVGFYALSTFLAIVVGLAMVNLISPGLDQGAPNEVIRSAFTSGSNQEDQSSVQAKIELAQENADKSGYELFANLFRQMLPPNIISAASNNGQMLGVLVFAIMMAIAITKVPKENSVFLSRFFTALNEVMILITRWIMAVAPIGIYALILPVVYESGGGLFSTLGKYFGTVAGALLIHLVLVLPLLLFVLGKIHPLFHFRAMRTALLTAFSTASSSATLPLTLRSIQERAGVSKRVSSFTIPLGATVNMDGTALYECVAVLFVAQVMGVEMGIAAQAGVVIAALLTSVGVAGIPSASLVAIFIILQNSGIPGAEAAVAALLAVDRPLDMCRTAVNVFGDSCAAAVIAKSEGEELYPANGDVVTES